MIRLIDNYFCALFQGLSLVCTPFHGNVISLTTAVSKETNIV